MNNIGSVIQLCYSLKLLQALIPRKCVHRFLICCSPMYCIQAISRRVTLHEMIRDYDQAANDLRRQIAVMEKQLKDEEIEIGFSIRVGCNSQLKRAHARLGSLEEEAKKMTPLDFYQIL